MRWRFCPIVLSITVDAHVRAAWQEQVAVAVKTPGLAPALLPRFAAYYIRLRALPRRMRRALQRKWKHSLAGVALLLALGQEPALAATIPVNATCSLVNALTAANTDTATGGCPQGNGADTIRLPVGSTQTLTTVNNSTFGPTGSPVITSTITIEGNDSTIERGSSAPEFRIFAVGSGGNLILKDTTISGGLTVSSNGGGVFNDMGGILTIQNSTISGNATGYFSTGSSVENSGILTIQNSTISGNAGGGVHNNAILTITNSTISGNRASITGGGVHNNGILTLTDSTVSSNRSSAFNYLGGRGGGVRNDGTLTITNSTISGNGAEDGGGVMNYGTLTIQNSTISGNGANRFSFAFGPYGIGGGVMNFGTLTLTDSTVSSNGANYRGGGVMNYGALTIENSTLSHNVASGSFIGDYGDGGGVFNFGTLTLTHTLVSGNAATFSGPEINSPGAVTANAVNLFGHDGDAGVSGFTPGPTDVVPTVPLSEILAPLYDNGGPTFTHALVSGSPAIDAVASGCPPPATDQRGFLRPADGDSTPGALCDIGSFEFNATPAVLEVTLDIKPGEFSNTINPKSNGVIAVALLSTPDFNAATVDPLSVEFGPQGALEAHGKGHIEDVNGDGKKDLVLHFRTQETGIACGDTSVSLTGVTFTGDPIQGSDSISTVGCK